MRIETLSLHLVKYLTRHGLDRDTVEKILKIGKYKMLPKGEIFFLDSSPYLLCLVLQGKLKLVCNGSEDGESDEWLFIDILREGDFAGDLALSGKDTCHKYIEPITKDALICFFAIGHIRELFRQDAKLGLMYISSLSNKLNQTEKEKIWLTRGDAKMKLILFFQNWARQEGVTIGNKVVLKKDMTIIDIASYLSVSRQTLHSILRDLSKANLIEWGRKTVTVSTALWAV
jgi:CRP-like cAMP-binding protein